MKTPLNSSTPLSSASTSASSSGNDEDKEEGWKRQEDVVRQYSSSSLSSTKTQLSHSNKTPHHLSNTHTHQTTHKHTHKHTHHKHTKRNRDKATLQLPRLVRRRRRALEWPSWTTDYFYYPFHHDEDTISGLGGSPAWFHRELARFNSEGSRSYADHQTPIAIYPQGPLTHDPHAKGHIPGPNYIEGVWEPEDYTLQIKYTKPEDAGTYICQINTEPRITQVVHLSVVSK